MFQFFAYETIGVTPYRWADDESYRLWHDDALRPLYAWAMSNGSVVVMRDADGQPLLKTFEPTLGR